MAGVVIGAGGVGLAWAAAGADGKVAASPTAGTKGDSSGFTLLGTMTLSGSNRPVGSDGCAGRSGYDDILEGTSVTVYDASGKVVAEGELGGGIRKGTACEFPVHVGHVPETSNFYQVEVSHRGKLTVSVDDAKAGRFAASLG
ncbi:hypothetical protein [Kitasatospora sp. MBT63]|uniref:hypothetical protein n=1 Tax=Kitasatospora sp. MBT63 TaxID=1444768 RepID=UPI000A6C5883|nr:hypothetical protein [Kitasatospora sp. MBT63]